MTAAAMDEAGRPEAGLANGRQPAPVEELFRLLTDERTARAGAQAREEALVEVLQVMSRRPGDPQRVFEVIARHARVLCAAEAVSVFEFKDDLLHARVLHSYNTEAIVRLASAFPRPPSQDTLPGRAILSGSVIHVHDMQSDPAILQAGRALGVSVGLVVPLLSGKRVIGCISLNRFEKQPFLSGEIALVENFAAQAVIAMENARLITEQITRQRELEEALESQTATSEILNVIARSPNDSQPVFETIARSVRRLTDALRSAVYTYDGDLIHLVAFDGAYGAEGVDAMIRAFPQKPGGTSATTRAVATGEIQYIPDVQADPDYAVSYVARAANYRSVVSVPMLRDGRPVGAITAGMARVAAFSERKIALLKTFAEQAAIALAGAENYHALQERSAELARSVIE